MAVSPDDLATTPGGDLATPMPDDLATTPVTGMLAGAIARNADATLDLTALGTLDWAHWGRATATSFDHKNLATALISNITTLGGGNATQYGSYAVGWTWSDGTPTTSATNTTTGVYTLGNGTGFRITAPADTTTRILKLYLGGQTSTGTLVAHLSDGSAGDYTVSTQQGAGDGGNQYERTVTLTYRATSAAQTLRVDWTVSSNNGYVHLHSATLQ